MFYVNNFSTRHGSSWDVDPVSGLVLYKFREDRTSNVKPPPLCLSFVYLNFLSFVKTHHPWHFFLVCPIRLSLTHRPSPHPVVPSERFLYCKLVSGLLLRSLGVRPVSSRERFGTPTLLEPHKFLIVLSTSPHFFSCRLKPLSAPGLMFFVTSGPLSHTWPKMYTLLRWPLCTDWMWKFSSDTDDDPLPPWRSPFTPPSLGSILRCRYRVHLCFRTWSQYHCLHNSLQI